MAGISLQKGGNVSLTKQAPGLKHLAIGLGWDIRTTGGPAFDLDASVFLLNSNGKLLSKGHFVYYGNLNSPDGSVQHQGDNLTGAGEGDDEVINVDLERLPAEVDKLVFTVTIYQAEQRKQNFGMVQNAFIRVVDRGSGGGGQTSGGGGGLMSTVSQLFGGSSPTGSGSVQGQELTRYDLGEEFSMETAMIFGELYRYKSEWKFRAVGQGFAGGLNEMIKNYN